MEILPPGPSSFLDYNKYMHHPSRKLLFYLICFLLFVAYASFFGALNLSNFYIIVIVILAMFFWPLKIIRYSSLLFLTFLLANYFTFLKTPQPNDLWIQNHGGKTTEQEYVVTDSSPGDGNTQYLTVRSLDVNLKGNLLVITRKYPSFEYGETLKIKGEIKKLTEDGVIKPRKNLGIYGEIYFPESVENLQNRDIPWDVKLRRPLVLVRKRFENQISKLINEPEAGLLAGILLGTRTNISDALKALLAATGTAHIIALSGYNITIVAEMFRRLFRFRSRNWSFFLPVLGILTFVLATGLSASVIRAAIMGIILLLAKRLGRPADSMVGILLASAVMVAFNPFLLLYDIGFQLSFAAIFGIIYVAPLFVPFTKFLGSEIGPTLAATLAAQLMTLPLISFYFGELSLIAPLANLLILPFIPILMTYSFITILISFASLWLGKILAFGSWLVLNYFFNTMEFLGSLKYAKLAIKFGNPLILIGLYLIILELVLVARKLQHAQKII